ncbi:hypothetical protein D3C76_1871090 [compost metagenome]
MLDDQQRTAVSHLTYQAQGVLGLFMGHARHRLVEQDYPRVTGQGHADLQGALFRVRKLCRAHCFLAL